MAVTLNPRHVNIHVEYVPTIYSAPFNSVTADLT